MEENELITIEQICLHYNIPDSFINSLREYELIEVVTRAEVPYVHQNEVSLIEKMMRMHYDLHINMEGLDVVNHLLRRVESLQTEVNQLNNRLRIFDEDF